MRRVGLVVAPPPWQKRLGLGVSAALAVMMAVVAAAWACTAQMPPLVLSPTSGNVGSTVTAKVSTGLRANSTYKLNFNDAKRVAERLSCHTTPTVIKTGITTNGSGGFSTSATIPTRLANGSATPKGTSQICGVETFPLAGNTVTSHSTYTVV